MTKVNVSYPNGHDASPGETVIMDVDTQPVVEPITVSILVDGVSTDVILSRRSSTEPTISVASTTLGSADVHGRRIKFTLSEPTGTPTDPTPTAVFTDPFVGALNTNLSSSLWTVTATTGSTAKLQGDNTAKFTTGATGSFNDAVTVIANQVPKPAESVLTSVTLASAAQPGSFSVYLADGTWFATDGEIPTNGHGISLIPADPVEGPVVKMRNVVAGAKTVTSRPYTYDGAHLKVWVFLKYADGVVEATVWNDGSTQPTTPTISVSDNRIAGPFYLQMVAAGGAPAAAQSFITTPPTVVEVVAPPVVSQPSANLRAATGVYTRNYMPPYVAAWEALHGVTAKYITVYTDATAGTGNNFGGSVFGSFAPVDWPTTETWHGSNIPWTSANIGSRVLSVAVPLAFKGDTTATTFTLDQVAAGAADGLFSSAAARMKLVSNDGSQIILRLGWEWDGNWYKWAINWTADGGSRATRAPTYARAWQHVAGIFRAAMPNIKFCWNGSNGLFADNYNSGAYPGDAWVDYVALDVYDWGYGINTTTAARDLFWDQRVRPDIKVLGDFANAHQKLIAIPEWGCGIGGPNSGGGDDTSFVDRMFAFLRDGVVTSAGNADRFGVVIPAGVSTVVTPRLGYHAWFDTSLADGSDFRLATFPNAQAHYNSALAA